MTNITALAESLRNLDFTVKQNGEYLHVEGWMIFCTITGRVQTRNVYDDTERFTLGTLHTTSDILAEVFAETVALW